MFRANCVTWLVVVRTTFCAILHLLFCVMCVVWQPFFVTTAFVDRCLLFRGRSCLATAGWSAGGRHGMYPHGALVRDEVRCLMLQAKRELKLDGAVAVEIREVSDSPLHNQKQTRLTTWVLWGHTFGAWTTLSTASSEAYMEIRHHTFVVLSKQLFWRLLRNTVGRYRHRLQHRQSSVYSLERGQACHRPRQRSWRSHPNRHQLCAKLTRKPAWQLPSVRSCQAPESARRWNTFVRKSNLSSAAETR